MEWVALTHAHERKQGPPQHAVRLEASGCVGGARRDEPAYRAEPHRERPLVEPNQRDEEVPRYHSVGSFGAAVWVFGGVLASALRNESARAAMRRPAPRHSESNPSRESDPTAEFFGITTTSRLAGKRSEDRRKASRIRRFARLRRTASPNLRVTVIPSRAGSPSRRAARRTMQLGRAIREPDSWTGRNSRRLRSRFDFGKACEPRPLNGPDDGAPTSCRSPP
jgi:hypothetical protein